MFLLQERTQVFLKNPVTDQPEAEDTVLPTHGVLWYVEITVSLSDHTHTDNRSDILS